MSFRIYQEAVLKDYKLKKNGPKLDTNLIIPAPAKLKRQCEIEFGKRYAEKDEMILRSFFEPKAGKENLKQAIENCDIDRFRPLQTVMIRGSGKTDVRNIELLAWLIDFEPRPYTEWEKIPVAAPDQGAEPHIVDQKLIAAEPLLIAADEQAPIPISDPIKRSRKNWILWLAVVVFAVGSAYLIWAKRPPVVTTRISKRPPVKCMYWAGENFVEGGCSTAHGDTPVIAFDTASFNGLKKIKDSSVLTKRSLKRTWYAKIDGQVEFYTDSGMHPVDTARRLLPLSRYMLRKYALSK